MHDPTTFITAENPHPNKNVSKKLSQIELLHHEKSLEKKSHLNFINNR
jgi:hypothetical protein